jgi:hypothetical protein
MDLAIIARHRSSSRRWRFDSGRTGERKSKSYTSAPLFDSIDQHKRDVRICRGDRVGRNRLRVHPLGEVRDILRRSVEAVAAEA